MTEIEANGTDASAPDPELVERPQRRS